MSQALTVPPALKYKLDAAWGRAVEQALPEQRPTVIPWAPFPGPQTMALESQADEVFFGGAAGGGKTFLLLGLALTRHQRSIIFRREYAQLAEIIEQLRTLVVETDAGRFYESKKLLRLNSGAILELGAVEHERDVRKFQGRAHDLKCFDELTHFSEAQYRFLSAWNRGVGRCRIVATGNPPVPGQGGEWVMRLWAPWLDSQFPDPAESGELRWYYMRDGEEVWADGPGPVSWTQNGVLETATPLSRTFIRARVEDNPVLWDSGYAQRLEALPEPLRSLLRHGDFNASSEDDPWQVIPTSWVLAAQLRWRQGQRPDMPLSAVGVDVARGGHDETTVSRRWGPWFELGRRPGKLTPDGPSAAEFVLKETGGVPPAPVYIDAIGVGMSAIEVLKMQGCQTYAVNASARPTDGVGHIRVDATGRYPLRTTRAYMYWRLREALDPETGDQLCLPDERDLLIDLCAQRYEIGTSGIILEDKEKVRQRIGRSPDLGDAVCLSFMALPPVGVRTAKRQGQMSGIRGRTF